MSNVSAEEGEMRQAAIAWGMRRWPGARVVHELAVGGCRIDLAFVQPGHLAGVEIKSSRDTLDRLERQLSFYVGCIPEVWIAFAPRWIKHFGIDCDYRRSTDYRAVGQLIIFDGNLIEEIPEYGGRLVSFKHPARADRMMTAPMLHLLHRSEMLDLSRMHHLPVNAKACRKDLEEILARRLTGDQIVDGVCSFLRARSVGWEADDPIPLPPR